MTELNDLRPLDSDRASGLEARLGRDLHFLFPTNDDALPEDLWLKLEAAARRSAERNRRRHLLRTLLGSFWDPRILAPVAVAASLAIGLAIWHRSSAPAANPAGTTLVLSGTEATPRLATLDSGVALDVKGDVAVNQEPGGGDRVILRAGSVHASVPHLQAGRTFTVSTDLADVIVRGTRFAVRKTDEGTTVSVEEGLVEVKPLDGRRPTEFVKPGQSTTVVPFAAYVAGLAADVEHSVDAEKCEGSHDLVLKYLAVTSSPADMSAAVYLEGLCAARAGERAEAIGFFEQVAAIAPPARADNAFARAAQLHEQDGPNEGVQAWHRYLERFPQGLHQDLARRFLSDHETDP